MFRKCTGLGGSTTIPILQEKKLRHGDHIAIEWQSQAFEPREPGYRVHALQREAACHRIYVKTAIEGSCVGSKRGKDRFLEDMCSIPIGS